MSSVTTERVRAALEAVKGPDGRSLVAAGQVAEVELDGAAVTVVLRFEGLSRDARHALEDAAQSAVEGIEGVGEVTLDVQVIGDRLAVAANRKHCVELFDFDGETSGKAGARAAKGDDGAGFGGCCNPMNTCPAPDGTLLTSESNGVVKRFDLDGEIIEIVGKAEVRGGCKNSAIAIEPDGKRLYYIDSSAGRVLVLAAAEPVATVDAANPDVEE